MSERRPIKSVAIIGGTGTLGRALTSTITNIWPEAGITIISRDEHKQAQMKRDFPNAAYAIGDVKDVDSVACWLGGKDVVFHVAAMKHVDLIEMNPVECIKTNVLGTLNVARACHMQRVPYMAYSSTDKAVDPINTYGYSKALGEKMLFDLNKIQTSTRYSVYRWGNILGSQGSIIPLFIKSLLNDATVGITHPNMTRFWLPIEWPVTFMLRTFYEAKVDQAMVPPVMKAAPVTEVVAALAELLGVTNYRLIDIGMRPGEKIHEAMYSQHSGQHLTSFEAPQHTRDELKELLKPFVPQQELRAA